MGLPLINAERNPDPKASPAPVLSYASTGRTPEWRHLTPSKTYEPLLPSVITAILGPKFESATNNSFVTESFASYPVSFSASCLLTNTSFVNLKTLFSASIPALSCQLPGLNAKFVSGFLKYYETHTNHRKGKKNSKVCLIVSSY